MTRKSVTMHSLKELQQTCPRMSQLLTSRTSKKLSPKTMNFVHYQRPEKKINDSVNILFNGSPRWRGFTESLSNHERVEFFSLEERSMAAWQAIVKEIRSEPACALSGSQISLEQVVDEARDNLTTFELHICGFGVSGKSLRSALTPRGLSKKLEDFLSIPEQLEISAPEPWLINDQEVGAETAEQALLLWALWGDEDVEKILRKAHAPVVSKVISHEALLPDARKLRKRILGA